VVIVDDLSTGKIENINPEAKLYLMDIRSAELKKVFELEKPDIVNHHAAQKSVPESVKNPKHDADINIMGLLNLLELCVEYKVKKFIYVSSGGALAGDADIIPTDEAYIPKMISPYAITKYTGEKYLYFYSAIYGLEYTVLRYANVYGPRQTYDGECGVIPIFMNNILHNKPSRLNTYSDMPKGTTRDYIYVEDVCSANISALTKGENKIFNIGTGNELYIADIYDIIQKTAGSDLPLLIERERPGDVRRSALNSQKANDILKWRPEVSLKDGIQKTLKFYEAHKPV
jgi:UDP-glucose 4-epimerase